MSFTYPKTTFTKNTLADQLAHIQSEVREVQGAYHEPDITRLAEELCDLIHSAETALRILHDRYYVSIPVIQAYVIEKNRTRGYYCD
jgi:hypothetical protein